MEDDTDFWSARVFDAATAYKIVLGELMTALVESGALSREAVATILVRSERVISTFPPGSPAHWAQSGLRELVEQRLALQPDVFARRRSRKR